MTEPITVEINEHDLVNLPHLDMVETYIVGKLKKAGIPIIGCLLFGGLRSGTLKVAKSCEKMSTIYTWSPENKK